MLYTRLGCNVIAFIQSLTGPVFILKSGESVDLWIFKHTNSP